MNKIFKYSLALMTAAFTFAACSDSDDNYQKATWDAADGYYDVVFPKSTVTEELDPVEATETTLTIERKNKSGVATVPFNILTNTDDVFSVGEATFADGDSVANFKVTFPNAQLGKTYTLKLQVTDPKFSSSYSSTNSMTYKVTRVKWNLLGVGTFADNFWYEDESNVEIYQKDNEHNVYRVMHPFDSMLANPAISDAEKSGHQSESVTLTVRKDGLVIFTDMNSGYFHPSYGADVMLYHPSAFSSLQDESNWVYSKVVSYQEDGATPGQIQLAPYYYMDGVGGWNNTKADGVVVITFPGFVPPYTPVPEEDFEWTKEFTGVFFSEQLGTNTNATLYKGKCTVTKNDADKIFEETYGTLYRLESPYAEGYDIFFTQDAEGNIKVPAGYELQATGLDAVGTPVYAKISGANSEYRTNYLELVMTFQNEDGSLTYGKATEKLINPTYTEVGKGVYTYNVAALSDGGSSFYEGSEDATLYHCNELPEQYYLKPWAKSEDGLNFTISAVDGKIRFYQFTGEAFQNYGDVYFMDLEAYNPNYTQYLGEYDAETKTFEFCGAYYIPGAGGFGLVAETFQLNGAAAPLKAATRSNSLKLMFKNYKAANRFGKAQPTKQFMFAAGEALMK